ncbi:hypothetical protein PENTCL1PPCAC_25278, partial [Pristionchus entomophagus]
MACENAIPSDQNTTVTVLIDNQKIVVDVPYVSKWSQFLQAYFASNMKESANGIYPIKECSAVHFREMLEVIYPSSKPIHENNVDAMLELGDRFIMPMLTRKCEVFLSKKSSHGISEIRMLGMADRFNLLCTRTIVLERLSPTESLRSVCFVRLPFVLPSHFTPIQLQPKKAIGRKWFRNIFLQRFPS